MATLREGNEAGVGEIGTGGQLQIANEWTILCDGLQRRVGELLAIGETEELEVRTTGGDVFHRLVGDIL